MLELHNLCLKAGERTLLHELNWQVKMGERWVLIGRNGVGKTTLLRTLVGMQPPESGHLIWEGQPITAWSKMAMAQEMAYLPQGRHDPFGYRVIETVLAARYPWQGNQYWDSAEDTAFAYEAMQQMGVADLAMRDIRTLSGGERQRVAIATVLTQHTRMLVLDEPMNGLDMVHQVLLTRVLKALSPHKAILMVLHDLNMAYDLATHVLLLHGDGRWQAGAVSEVMTQSALSDCVGHAVTVWEKDGRRVFLAE